MTQKMNQNPWTMDVRVRERNLKSGALTEKDLEKYLATLPDLADQSESFGTAQPALAQPQHHVQHQHQAHHVASVSSGAETDMDADDVGDTDESEPPSGDLVNGASEASVSANSEGEST